MTEPITVVIPGAPKGKGRARSFIQRGRIVTTTPPDTREYEDGISRLAMVAMRGKRLLDGPLHMDMRAHFAIPASWSKKKRESALLGELLPVASVDLDNVVKAVADALNGIVYNDDRQIVSINCKKVYAAAEPFIVATIKPAYHGSQRVPEIHTTEPAQCQNQG